MSAFVALSDLQLAQSLQKGNDIEAFKALHERYVQTVFRYLHAFLPNPLEAEAVTEKVLLRVWEAWPRLRDEDISLSAYVLRMARILKEGDHFSAALEEPFSAETDSLLETLPAFSEMVAIHKEYRELRQVIGPLPAEQRDILLLRFLCHLSPGETAQVIDHSAERVYLLQLQALERVRQALGEEELAPLHPTLPNASVLQTCLDRIYSGRTTVDSAVAQYPEQASSLRGLIRAALWVHSRQRALAPQAAFLTASSSRLVARLQQKRLLANHSHPWPQNFPGKKTTSLVVSMVIFLLGIGLAGKVTLVSIARALPGEALYSAKLAGEQIQLALSATPIGDARLQIQFAQQRCNEINVLIIEDRPHELDAALARYGLQIQLATQSLQEAAHANPEEASQLTVLYSDVLSRQATTLHVLEDSIPAEVRTDLEHLSDTADRQLTAVQTLKGQLITISATPSLPGNDLPSPTRTAFLAPSSTSPLPSDTPALSPSVSPSPTLAATTAVDTPTATIPAITEVSATPDHPLVTTPPATAKTPHPTQPSKPTKTPKPGHPTKPANPDHPTKPANPEHPTKPPKP